MTLTEAQLVQLANKLRGTRANVYSVVESMFNVVVGDEIFDQLREAKLLFKCEECGEWLVLQHEDRSLKDLCTQCVDKMDGKGGDDEFDD